MKKAIFFVNGDTNHDSRFYTGEKRFPVGIGFMISILIKNGWHVDLCDRFLNKEKWVNVKDYDFIGVYTSSVCFKDALYIMEKSNKERKKGSILAVGGPHASLYPDTFPNYIDHIVRGEGEEIIIDLANGIIKEKIIETKRILDLDYLPFSPWDIYMQNKGYHTNSSFDKVQPVWNMNTSRGCPFNCKFCHVSDIWGKKIVGMSAERIVDEISYIKNKYNVQGIYFREDLFTYSKKRILDFCELNNKSTNIKWYCESRVDLDEEMIKTMKESGCSGLYLGVESGSQKMLDFYNKKTTVDQIISFFDILHKYQIPTYASFVVGHSIETKKDIDETNNLIKKIKPSFYYKNTYREDF